MRLGSTEPRALQIVRVDVLDRYRYDAQLMPTRRFDNLRVTVLTIQFAKRPEAV